MENTANQVGGLSAEDIAFDKKINNLGRYTSIIALAGMFAVPIVITLAFGIEVKFGEMIAVAGSLIALFAPMAIVENISYYAVIGAGGVYLSCISGNIMNMKLPCALSGMQIAGVEPGSKKGDIISILSIGISSLVTTIILFLGMLVVGEVLAPLLSNEILAPGFANIMPALMGALAVPMVIKNGKISVAPVVISLAICIIMGPAWVQSKQSYLLPVLMLLSVGVSYLMYKKGMLDEK